MQIAIIKRSPLPEKMQKKRVKFSRIAFKESKTLLFYANKER